MMSWCGHTQEKFAVEFQKSIKLNADKFIGVNMFDEQFIIQDNTLLKVTNDKEFAYNNVQLGAIHDVNIINSLQYSVFHKDFNVYVQLDKKLGVQNTINFNNSTNLSGVSYAATTSNKRLWVFNSDTQQLQIYNPQHDNIEAESMPIQHQVLKLYSNYNFCWVLSKTTLQQFNVYGNLLNSYALEGYDDFTYYRGFIIVKKANELYILSVDAATPQKINLPEIPIKEFSVTNETLYIYTGKELHTFTINLK